jgi:hypothetical protein
MKMQTGFIGVAILILALAGCSGAGDAGGESKTEDGATKTATANWDATNACALLDKAAVGAALNDKVTEATVGLVNQASGANAATSECTYILEGGGRASLMTRNSPIADNTDDAIKMARDATQQSVSAFTDKKVEDVSGLGKAAFFVPGINQLNVFIDDKRFVILTISSAPNESAKAVAIDLFGKVEK